MGDWGSKSARPFSRALFDVVRSLFSSRGRIQPALRWPSPRKNKHRHTSERGRAEERAGRSGVE
eukprot:9474163-Pyramimonas_sp.AAC.1